MQQLFLIRHGLTEWNARGKFQGHSDIALSEAGRAQAQALRVRLAELERSGLRLDWVVSSPLKRALQTAELALPEREIHLDERLKELNFGAFEGHTLAQNRATEAWNAWYDDPFKQSDTGGRILRAVAAPGGGLVGELAHREQRRLHPLRHHSDADQPYLGRGTSQVAQARDLASYELDPHNLSQWRESNRARQRRLPLRVFA